MTGELSAEDKAKQIDLNSTAGSITRHVGRPDKPARPFDFVLPRLGLFEIGQISLRDDQQCSILAKDNGKRTVFNANRYFASGTGRRAARKQAILW